MHNDPAVGLTDRQSLLAGTEVDRLVDLTLRSSATGGPGRGWRCPDLADFRLAGESGDQVKDQRVSVDDVLPAQHFRRSWFWWGGLLALSVGILVATADRRAWQSVAESSRLASETAPRSESISRPFAAGDTAMDGGAKPRGKGADQAASGASSLDGANPKGSMFGVTFRRADTFGVASNNAIALSVYESSNNEVPVGAKAVGDLATSIAQPALVYAAQDSSRNSRVRLDAQQPGDLKPATQRATERTSSMILASKDEGQRVLAGLSSPTTRDRSLPSRLWSSWREFLTLQITVQSLFLFSAFVLLWHGLFSSFGARAPSMAAPVPRNAIASMAKIAICGVLVIAVLSILFAVPPRTTVSFEAGSLTVIAGIALASVTLRKRLRGTRSSGADVRHFVIVGTNARAVGLARRIEANPALGYRLVGFVDQQWSGEVLFRQTGYKIVSDFAGFSDFIKDHVVDEVVICAPVKSLYDLSSRIFSQCEEQGITIRYGSDLFNSTIGQPRVDRLGEEVLLTVGIGRQVGPSLFVKRLIDVVGSAVLIPLLFPLLLTVAAAIKFTSPGPVLFAQERVGLNKRRFRMYKFRTMVVDAEQRQAELEHRNEVGGPVFKIKQDPRITSIGGFLRKTSLDELPQLVNVLKGDMSLVGPRPLAVRDYRGFTEDWHRRRLSVRPGMTCLWQVLGRSSIPFERWMELDMEYIDKWSIGLDLKILLKTLPAVMRGSGAS